MLGAAQAHTVSGSCWHHSPPDVPSPAKRTKFEPSDFITACLAASVGTQEGQARKAHAQCMATHCSWCLVTQEDQVKVAHMPSWVTMQQEAGPSVLACSTRVTNSHCMTLLSQSQPHPACAPAMYTTLLP